MNNFLPQSMNTPTALLLMLLGFGLLIFVHELGHFLAAKLVGIKVTQFAIGFGRSILAWRKGIGLRLGSTEPEFIRRVGEYLRSTGQAPAGHAPADQPSLVPWSDAQIDQAMHHLGLGETEYRINWLPLGGYVKMLGQEDLDPSARSDYFRAFNRKPAWARALVIVAGVTMNLLVGMALFILAFAHGVNLQPPLVGLVSPDSPAAQAFPIGHESDPALQGLRPGDRILRIDDQTPTDFLDVSIATALARPDQPLQLLVQRPGLPDPLLFAVQPQRSPHTGMLAIGITPPSDLTVAHLPNDPLYTPFLRAGLRPGMRIIAIDDQPIHNFADLYQHLFAAAGHPLTLTFYDPPSGRSTTATLRARPLLAPPASPHDPPNLLGLTPVSQITAVDSLASPSSRAGWLRRRLYSLGLDVRSPAETVGLQPGDILAQVGFTPWPRPDQVPAIVRSAQRRPLALAVWRNNQFLQLPAITPNYRGMIGISLIPSPQPLIGPTLPGSPAAALNLPPGSRLLAINTQPVQDWTDIQHLLQQLAADSSSHSTAQLHLTFQLNVAGSPQETLRLDLDDSHLAHLAAARWAPPLLELLEPLRQTYLASTPWQACRMGLHKTRQFVIQTYLMLARLIQGSVPVDNLYGPVGIFQAGTQIARESGWSPFLFFLGLLSVNLAVLNLLPLPIVDGGLLLFLLIEKIKGSPVNPAIQNAVNYLGLALLAAIFLMVTYFDIMRWF